MSDYSDFIDDGYTEPGNIDADPGIHGPLKFEYRPMVPAVQGRLLEKKGSDEFNAMTCRLLGGKDALLKSWTLVNSKKEPVVISEANLARVRPGLFDKLWQIIAGIRASDGAKMLDLTADAKNLLPG